MRRANEPPNLGKAVRLPVPDFNDPQRSPVCLEVDFPITPINALSKLEGNAGKPIYQMSKWWARRRSSVFRSLLIAAATQAPQDPAQAAKLVWEHYYTNHQKAGSFKKLRVLDIFMGGGTTLVEGERLGFQVVGLDLNPVAWFVSKNELACSDPEQVKAFFDHIEAEVKPLVQPFYVTTCPRGHRGRWIDTVTGKSADVDPLNLSSEDRKRYRWEGPEVIYTFWGKHGTCQSRDCGHRTPIFKNPVIAEKKLTTAYIETTCPSCGHTFNVELGETRLAPGAERVVLDTEPSFTETTQAFARLLNDYSKGNAEERFGRVGELLALVDHEPGLQCPKCGAFAGNKVKEVLSSHARARRVRDLKKQDFGIQSRSVYMFLLIHPDWFQGSGAWDHGTEMGGYAGADPESSIAWFEKRLEGLRLIEVRGRIKLAEEEILAQEEGEEENPEDTGDETEEETADRKKYGLPREITLADGTRIQTRVGTVPSKATFRCYHCGRQQSIFDSTAEFGKTQPVAVYALQCYCPQCEAEGYNYGGRYFKAPDAEDLRRLAWAEWEWTARRDADLAAYWPRQEIAYGERTHKRDALDRWGYTHWWKMFNPRQLLVHAQLLRAITEAPEERWPLDVREQALGAFQQYLRNQNMFAFWNPQRDTPEPMFSNPNYHPKQQVIENCVFNILGRGNWISSAQKVVEAVQWSSDPWELFVVGAAAGDGGKKSGKVKPGDPLKGITAAYCGSATDLSMIGHEPFDLVITDPPFGDNVFYADLADFFYVWLRIPLLRWYTDLPERAYFEPERTPHALEAVDNPVEHPDDREKWEREPTITRRVLARVRELTGNPDLKEKERNPLYRPEPSSEFYQQTLMACWAEANRLLKPGGLMAFTFHHNEDETWVNVLEALFGAGFILVATYPIRSDETKGERAQFGSQKIEYDIIHVCRKRLEPPQPVSWARMRRWVKEETARLKELLEHSHGKGLSEADLRVVLRGKALEFYSRHYSQVYTGEGEVLTVQEALLGINQLLDDLLHGEGDNGRRRPSDVAEPATRLFLYIFQGRTSLARDDLHKMLRGTGVSQDDLEARGWIRSAGTTVYGVPIAERFRYFTAPGRNRKVIKTDLDQAHFLIGAAQPGSGVNVMDELDRHTFQLKRAVDAILEWYAETDPDANIREAARLALDLVRHWRARPTRNEGVSQMTLFDRLEAEEAP
ncbi:SAM-dependent methyltransferase [Neomoorella mulderi]|uniref:DNA methylase n=1 Tax=Moorella mulderi DSM 14980 TaxID=1122241 RepID=A0A151AXS1_9FIRM|nr:SAM-dependent methyltransferase [Moorella mulderi]KYH32454.1 DNA methylase [Moorella mulderi DSM 14980]